MPRIIRRADWGARPPKSSGFPIQWSEQTGIAVHHSAGSRPYDHRNCAAIVRRIQRQHMAGEYSDIAYNFIKCRHDFLFEGRGFNATTGANGSWTANRRNQSIMIFGDDPPASGTNLEAIHAFRNAILARAPQATLVRPHSAFVSTACPGDNLRRWIASQTWTEEENEMTPEDLEKVAEIARREALNAAGWAVTAATKVLLDRQVPTASWISDSYKQYIETAIKLANEREKKMHGGTSNVTQQELEEAVKQALREGTGV